MKRANKQSVTLSAIVGDALEMKIEAYGSALRWPGHDLPDWIIVHHPQYSQPVYMAAGPPDKRGWRHYESGGRRST